MKLFIYSIIFALTVTLLPLESFGQERRIFRVVNESHSISHRQGVSVGVSAQSGLAQRERGGRRYQNRTDRPTRYVERGGRTTTRTDVSVRGKAEITTVGPFFFIRGSQTYHRKRVTTWERYPERSKKTTRVVYPRR